MKFKFSVRRPEKWQAQNITDSFCQEKSLWSQEKGKKKKKDRNVQSNRMKDENTSIPSGKKKTQHFFVSVYVPNLRLLRLSKWNRQQKLRSSISFVIFVRETTAEGRPQTSQLLSKQGAIGFSRLSSRLWTFKHFLWSVRSTRWNGRGPEELPASPHVEPVFQAALRDLLLLSKCLPSHLSHSHRHSGRGLLRLHVCFILHI